MSAKRILLTYGTRPEAIKLAPVIHRLGEVADFEPVVCVTAQHRTMLDQVNSLFGIRPDVDLDLMQSRQTIDELTARVLTGVQTMLGELRPDAVVVQGDTTTAFAAALAAFYAQVPVVHLEAGLRTDDIHRPFPEEMNRRLISRLAVLHLAPTVGNRANLLREGIDPETVVVTGNTVIDALQWALAAEPQPADPQLRGVLASDGPVLLLTAHRRESWGEPLRQVAAAIRRLTELHPELTVLLPMHRNPAVAEALAPLGTVSGVEVTEPLSYTDFVLALRRSTVVLSDSGGIQEEAPSLGKPVLVLRDVTERPEAVAAGCVRLVGTRADRVVDAVSALLSDPAEYDRMARSINPYGDGLAAGRAVDALRYLLADGERPVDFEPVDFEPVDFEPIDFEPID